jgi:hypothetical protein
MSVFVCIDVHQKISSLAYNFLKSVQICIQEASVLTKLSFKNHFGMVYNNYWRWRNSKPGSLFSHLLNFTARNSRTIYTSLPNGFSHSLESNCALTLHALPFRTSTAASTFCAICIIKLFFRPPCARLFEENIIRPLTILLFAFAAEAGETRRKLKQC